MANIPSKYRPHDRGVQNRQWLRPTSWTAQLLTPYSAFSSTRVCSCHSSYGPGNMGLWNRQKIQKYPASQVLQSCCRAWLTCSVEIFLSNKIHTNNCEDKFFSLADVIPDDSEISMWKWHPTPKVEMTEGMGKLPTEICYKQKTTHRLENADAFCCWVTIPTHHHWDHW